MDAEDAREDAATSGDSALTSDVDEDALEVMPFRLFGSLCREQTPLRPARSPVGRDLRPGDDAELPHSAAAFALEEREAWRTAGGEVRDGVEYRCEAVTLDGFIQQLAVSYLGRGYFFYVTGTIREGRDPRDIDRRIVERYGIAISKFTRARRKKGGAASVQYLRHGRFFVLLATHGKHRFFDEEVGIKDARESPIRHEGYAVSVKAGHSCVRIDRGTYLNLKAYFEEVAAKRSTEVLSKQLRGLPFSPYAPVRSQFFAILRAVNRLRQAAGFEPVPRDAVRIRRAPVKTFASLNIE